MTVPPVNSTPRCRPLVARKITARTKVINEMMLNTSAWRMNGMSLRIRKNSIFSSSALDRANPFSGGRMPLVPVGIADRQLFEPAPRTEDQVHHAAGHQHGAEHRCQDAETVHDREPAYRTAAEHEQCDARDKGRSEEHTSELQSPDHLVCRLLLEKKKKRHYEAYQTLGRGASLSELESVPVTDMQGSR